MFTPIAVDVGPSGGLALERSIEAASSTSLQDLDLALVKLADAARPFAQTPIATKIQLLDELSRRLLEIAPAWVSAACRAKGIDPGTPLAGEEWIAGPGVTLRNVRLLIRSLSEIAEGGAPRLSEAQVADGPDGAVRIRVCPYDRFDGALYGGLRAETWLLPGVDRAAVRDNRAGFYNQQAPQGGVSLILGAGNVASIAPMDVLYKMFVEGHVCILKMNPVNEYLGPLFAHAFRSFIDRGLLAIVYGGGDVGAYLCGHRSITDVHITGSDKTHDVIVWGAPGAEQADRKHRKNPLLEKPITSELGNVSPVIVVPGPYTDHELASMAANVVGMVTNNASFNCNAAKMLVLPKAWPRRERFLALLGEAFAKVPMRKAYYPAAAQRHAELTKGHDNVTFFGSFRDGGLPWTLVLGLDPDNTAEKNFVTEPFCSVLSEVSLGDADPIAFLREVVPFVNNRLWGTLNAMLFVHPALSADPTTSRALDRAIAELRYGTVAVNVWPALAYALCSTPWGGHPSATLDNIQSGLGWVHNTLMLEGIDKCVLRAPLVARPKPAYFPSHKSLDVLGKKLVAFEASPSWLKIPGLALTALNG